MCRWRRERPHWRTLAGGTLPLASFAAQHGHPNLARALWSQRRPGGDARETVQTTGGDVMKVSGRIRESRRDAINRIPTRFTFSDENVSLYLSLYYCRFCLSGTSL